MAAGVPMGSAAASAPVVSIRYFYYCPIRLIAHFWYRQWSV